MPDAIWKEKLEKSQFNVFEFEGSVFSASFNIQTIMDSKIYLIFEIDVFPIVQQQLAKDKDNLKKQIISELENGEGKCFTSIILENSEQETILLDKKQLLTDTYSDKYKTYRTRIFAAILEPKIFL